MGYRRKSKEKHIWLLFLVFIVCFIMPEVGSNRFPKAGKVPNTEKRYNVNKKAVEDSKHKTDIEPRVKSESIKPEVNYHETSEERTESRPAKTSHEATKEDESSDSKSKDESEELSTERYSKGKKDKHNTQSSSGDKTDTIERDLKDVQSRYDSRKHFADKNEHQSISGKGVNSAVKTAKTEENHGHRSKKKSKSKSSFQSGDSQSGNQSSIRYDTSSKSLNDIIDGTSSHRRHAKENSKVSGLNSSLKKSKDKGKSARHQEHKSGTESRKSSKYQSHDVTSSKNSSKNKSKTRDRPSHKSTKPAKASPDNSRYDEKHHGNRSKKKSKGKSSFQSNESQSGNQSSDRDEISSTKEKGKRAHDKDFSNKSLNDVKDATSSNRQHATENSKLSSLSPSLKKSKDKGKYVRHQKHKSGTESKESSKYQSDDSNSYESSNKMKGKTRDKASHKNTKLAEASSDNSRYDGAHNVNRVTEEIFVPSTASSADVPSQSTTSYSRPTTHGTSATTKSGAFSDPTHVTTPYSLSSTSVSTEAADGYQADEDRETEENSTSYGWRGTEKTTTTEVGAVTSEPTTMPPVLVIKPPYPNAPICMKRTQPCCVAGKLELNLGTFHRKGDAFGELEGVDVTKMSDAPEVKFIRCSFGAEIKASFEAMGNEGCFGCTKGPFCGRRMLQMDLELSQNKRRDILFEITDSMGNGSASVYANYPNVTIRPRNSANNGSGTSQIVIQGAVNAYTNKLTFYIGNQFIRVTNDKRLDENFCNNDLFHLNGQFDPKSGGMSSNTITIGINRAISNFENNERYGVCAATLSWACPWPEI